MSQGVSRAFESDFLSRPLASQVAECDRNELAPLFLRCFRSRQPVLEAGCGSGRWCAWLGAHGIRCDGIDWSEELCARAAREIPGSRFIACDMSQVPLPDGTYGGLMALGSVEHAPEGPVAALREFRRLLRPGGIAVITVPYGGRLRATMQRAGEPLQALKGSPRLRRAFGKAVGETTLADARTATTRSWRPSFSHGPEGWFFYEYEFDKTQMRASLASAGLEVRLEFVAYGEEGIFHTFGRLAGTWDPERARLELTPVGRVLRAVLPVAVMGHMLCYVVEKAKHADATR
jgi:SAM-dependent methyltransferase